MAILPLLRCLHPEVTMTTIRQLSRIAPAMLAMTGRVTMLGISRWAGAGGSYRTVQRLFATVIPWASLFWLFFRTHLFQPDDVYLLAGDETVVTKAGTQTAGLDRLFASLYGKPVPGLGFFTLALISTQRRRSYPIQVDQVLRTDAEKATARAKRARTTAAPTGPKRKPGRPKGSTTTAKPPAAVNPELGRIQTMIRQVLQRIAGLVPLTYLVLDGHFGNQHALQMVRACGLHLISKLRADSALYLPYAGPYGGRGRRRIYGDKLNPQVMPERYLCQTTVEDGIATRIYQVAARHRTMAQALNIVIIHKTNRHTQAHAILFSSDMTLPWDQLIDDYRLRFQVEFNFRDAKQYWGLEDFMNTRPTAVTNAANLALFMVNLVERLRRDQHPDASVLDMKARWRGMRYIEETIQLLPAKPEPIILDRIVAKLVGIGCIHAVAAEPIPT